MRPISPSPHLSRLAIAALATCWAPLAAAQVAVLDKIGNTTGGLATTLGAGDFFGQEVTGIGDLDDDGIEDIAVGAFRDDDGAPNAGAIYVILMNFDGSVKAEQKISATSGGFLGDAVTGDQLAAFDEFGISVAALGDYDGDGNTELAVGAPGDDANTGAVWVLYLNDNGTVKSNKTRRITQLVPWSPTPGARFGTSVAGIGDIDTNFVGDLAVGAPSDSASGQSKGAVYIIPMFSNGTPDFSSQISEGLGGFTGQLDFDSFGAAVCDLGVNHIVVGAPADDDGGSNTGAIYVLEHNLSGTVQSFTKISQTSGGFSSQLDDFGFFGFSIEEIRTGISDNAPDLLVGAPLSNDGGTSQGAMWILFMDFSENLRGEVKISATTGGFTGTIDPGDKFGSGVAAADINL
ncbi:MAG: hypothetical protein GY711_05620, partial [bacterium]|nr:hypothetical protein [bacterium]